jgi:molybdopterin molybdotransferase
LDNRVIEIAQFQLLDYPITRLPDYPITRLPDLMRPFKTTITLEQARKRLDEHVRPMARTERVSLEQAAGRVAAADVIASIDVPPFARSAMDGYALLSADAARATRQTPVALRIVDRVYTGQLSKQRVESGSCVEIATGAPLPDGADAVVMVEETSPADDQRVNVLASVSPGQNIGRRAADIKVGDGVVKAGDWLNPSRIGALAAVGSSEVAVYARPRVAILSTGSEVIAPGMPLDPGHIYDVNRFTLSAIVAAHGGIPEPRQASRDTLEELTAALDACADADIIVFSGGSSVGDRDLIVDVIAARGDLVFHGVAVKPGKPTVFATIGRTPFFGMPGNPTSCLSNGYILLVPFLRTTARLPKYTPHTVNAPLATRIVSTAGRHHFYTVRLRDGAAVPAFKGSGEITSLSQADGYIEIPAGESVVEAGTIVNVTLF